MTKAVWGKHGAAEWLGLGDLQLPVEEGTPMGRVSDFFGNEHLGTKCTLSGKFSLELVSKRNALIFPQTPQKQLAISSST